MILLAAWVAFAAPPTATIAEVRAHPSHFAGRRIRLVGWVNSCQPLDCSISEALSVRPSGRGKRISLEEDQTLDASLDASIPAKVELEATFDDGCMTKYICMDRAPELRAVHIRRVMVTKAPFPDQDQ